MTAVAAPAGWRRFPVPSVGAVVFGLTALVGLLGAGVVVWGMPLQHPLLGVPGTFTEAPATATDLTRPRAASSPAVAADPRDRRFVVLAHRVDGPQVGCGLQVSGDGGESWMGADPVPILPAGVDQCHAPDVAFDAGGTLYFLFVGLVGPGRHSAGAFLTTSSDRARTFSEPLRVVSPLAFGVRLAVDREPGGGRVHVAWLQAEAEPTATGFSTRANRVLTAYSDDGGAHFSEPLAVSDPGGRPVAAPALALAPGGGVRVAYYDLGDDTRDYEGTAGLTWEGRWSLSVASSADRGVRFAPSVVVDDAVRPAARVPSIFTMAPPALATGKLGTCLSWTDARYGDADVLLRCVTRAGRWGAAQRVNNDPRGDGHSQYLPQLAMSSGGRLDVAFYDRRSDARNEMVAVAFAYSYDGRNFSLNVALARSLFSAAVGPRPIAGAGAPVDFGSRLGLESQGSSALIAWTDTRNTTDGAAGQDIYVAQASLLFSSGRPPWAAAAGAALVAASAGSLALLRRRTTRRTVAGP